MQTDVGTEVTTGGAVMAGTAQVMGSHALVEGGMGLGWWNGGREGEAALVDGMMRGAGVHVVPTLTPLPPSSPVH